MPFWPRRARTRWLAAVAALAVLTCAGSPSVEAQRISTSHKLDAALRGLTSDGQHFVRVIVRTHAGAREHVKRTVRAHGDRIEADHAAIDAFTATVHAADLGVLASDPIVESVSIDAVVTPHGSSTTTQFGNELLTAGGLTGAGVRVAVIDSGLEPTSDLDERRIVGFYDFTRGGIAALPYDDYGHGTHVAGLIAGDGTNSRGYYVGIAPGAEILALKVLNSEGTGRTSNVIQAIDFVVANRNALNVDIINLSLGHPIFESAATDPLVLAVQKAAQAGIIVVVAAGNYGQNPTTGLPGYGGITSPGNAPSAITVGALNTQETIGWGDDTIPEYSSRGPTWYDAYAKPDIVAPGHRLVSVAALKSTLYEQYPNLRSVGTAGDIPRYFRLSGTSMATAVASGTAALMLEATGGNRNSFPRNALKAILEWTAIPVAGYDTLTQGAGAVNVAGALALTRKINPAAPVETYWLTSSVTPTTTIGNVVWPWARTVVWGNAILHGIPIDTNQAAWRQTVVWGNTVALGKTVVWGNTVALGKTVVWGNTVALGKTVVWGNTVLWGNTVVWANDVVWSGPSVWSSTVVWGNGLIGTRDGTTVVWGNTQVTPSTVVWGNLASVTGLSGAITFVKLADQP